LKLFRRIEAGPNPELEISEELTNQGFTRVPSLAGAIVDERRDQEAATLAIVQAVVTNQGSGWTFTIDELRRYYERVQARISRGDSEGTTMPAADLSYSTDGPEPPPFFAALEAWYLGAAGVLGRRTAELHLALASARGEAFRPEPFDAAALRELASTVAQQGADVLDLLAAREAALPDDVRPMAAAVLERRDDLLHRLNALGRVREAGQRIRVHGDYHLGQVLRTEEDFVIIDFEGEPARTLAERRAKYSPLKDVAGMLRSFHYAATAALMAVAQSTAGAMERLSPWAEAWQYWVSKSFLDSYRQTLDGTPILPREPAFDPVLDAFVLQKALYELGYELNNRPDWTRIPLGALAGLALPAQR
jgi:trehalose synthase-fused probable maltokinase